MRQEKKKNQNVSQEPCENERDRKNMCVRTCLSVWWWGDIY